MGGLAFANVPTESGRPVQTPRLPTALYQTLSGHYQRLLETLFERVVVPRDAPAKADHGDIDFLVEGIRPPNTKDRIWSVIQGTLQADHHLPRGGSSSYAVPHPELPDAHVQVDVELSVGNETPESAELFEWTRFMKGDSDLLQIVGVSHRPLGLTCNDRGLHVRIAEIEPYNKKKALLFLTRDPDKMIKFYGMDVAKYWDGFTDEKDLFDWATSGRFFSHRVFEDRIEKHNDRARQAKRPMYQRFVEDYMPLHSDRGAANEWTRQQVLQEALMLFEKREEYEAMLLEHDLKTTEEELWKDIKVAVPIQSNSLAVVLKGLKRWVVFEDDQPRISPKPNLDEPLIWSKFVTADNKNAVLEWVRQNWEQVKCAEKARANAAKESAKRTS
ncbi:hypothetical protein CC77DRAFT_1029474 [Alternaria alternata]|uniref:Uncharacterized protein n=2 Tax=Alternaria alternata complex TaxID=187734 RepID=A0A177DTK2_ALTAL|nr:hypothetical protein CC77DRAFT_1029474 [Alternaria alternata]XP_051588650.1 uncharacterized protein J4E82_005425 [Alternaria postmessia]RII21910.1 hypothetical protein CUC08_Gglean001079 [Alternaria sp. MG1]RYN82407.1 hypothetical protein AA0120_g9683 [Alternaria tenuissima]KAH6861642.1 hypothetical protein B0T12DRAFT_348027 [Alternaria alternata]KAI5375947.1 hypothetical protein J4E82_005425 [Alternaria postmessia]OAG22342.1 hypothetical protein CC77DRAFT_1029474 [Alternaria alternata]